MLPGWRAGAAPQLLPPPAGSAPPLCDNAPWCWGAPGGALGSCSGLEPRAVCLTSADDRPPYFLNPYEYEDSLDDALTALEKAVVRLGGEVLEKKKKGDGFDAYLWAYFAKSGVDGGLDVEWVFLPNDNIVDAKALSRGDTGGLGNFFGKNSATKLLEDVRLKAGWTEVYILRNRKNALIVGQSPFDGFGPTPPPVLERGLF
eukprot:gnl/TRDRNA2_/TRDRNA2_155623_c1_seq1.p1 gnl/TRDRNA2_/TRDRNA2_155623_c1~~gnl/TRDRNA2_/TRDRNA2_155623_c1_seq1.p1  ORF type:complete len:202 (-),score=50.63 gnl/TRDRNA2_/TRDRNA2_155623_c1_seq1:30-635(-)